MEGHEREILLRVHGLDQTLPLSVLGDVHDPPLHGLEGAVENHGPAVQKKLAGVVAFQPEERRADIGVAESQEPAQAQHLPLVEGEADVVEFAHPGQAANLKHRLAGFPSGPVEHQLDVLSHHQAGDLLLGDAPDFVGPHQLAVPEDRDLVGDLLDLFQVMGDVEDCQSLVLHAADDLEQRPLFGIRQRRSRFVHDDQPGVAEQALGDLHELLLGNREVSDRHVGRHPQAQSLQRFPGLAVHGPFVQQRPAEAGGFDPDEEVLHDRELGKQAELLVDDADTGGVGGPGIVEVRFLAVDQGPSIVFAVHPCDDLDQGGLARPVFSDQGVDPAAAKGDVHLFQGLHTREALAEVLNPQLPILSHAVLPPSRLDSS